MRVCFYNPQVILGRTLFSVIFRTNPDVRFNFILNFFRDKKYSTAIIVDGTSTSMTNGSLLVKFISDNYLIIRMISFVEVYIWCWLNGFDPFKQTIIFNKNSLDKDKDIIFGFAFFTDTFINSNIARKGFLNSFGGIKILHASHFFSRTLLISSNIRKTGTRLMVAEADLKKSDYFNKYFDFIEKVYFLPFVVRDRFKKNQDFHIRKNKCFATGALLVLCSDINRCHSDFQEYVKCFKTRYLQPMRGLIYENRENLSDIIDSCISPHSREYSKNNFKRILLKIFVKEKKVNKYYSFNIVDKFNEYKMFIAPEENTGLPSVNFIEGMLCGCAYIGLAHPMYTGFGLKDKVNYIAYDGTLRGLRDKIEYYQKHETELSKIAQSGYKLVRENFTEKKVMEYFWNLMGDIFEKAMPVKK